MVTQYAYPVEYTLLKKEYTHKKGGHTPCDKAHVPLKSGCLGC